MVSICVFVSLGCFDLGFAAGLASTSICICSSMLSIQTAVGSVLVFGVSASAVGGVSADVCGVASVVDGVLDVGVCGVSVGVDGVSVHGGCYTFYSVLAFP